MQAAIIGKMQGRNLDVKTGETYSGKQKDRRDRMGKIICLMGKSSAGKDTIYKKLLETEELNLRTVVPYTTRPIRAGEREGVEYHFTDEEGFLDLQKRGKVVEDRSYQTCHGLWRYFTVDEGIDPEAADYLLIGTPEACGKLRDYFGGEKILPILVEVDDGERLQRALNRERKQETPKYEEMCRRFLADAKDFSEEKLAELGNPRRFCNEDLTACLDEIIAYIKSN